MNLFNLVWDLLMEIKEYMTAILMIKTVMDLNFR